MSKGRDEEHPEAEVIVNMAQLGDSDRHGADGTALTGRPELAVGVHWSGYQCFKVGHLEDSCLASLGRCWEGFLKDGS